MIKDKKILVTGGAGFIGSHLCEHLVKNNEVWSIDNYTTGSVDNHVEGCNYITAGTHKISNLFFKADIVYHLGEYSRVEQSFDDFEQCWHSNVEGTIEVIKWAKECNAKLIYAGSSTKFGDIGANSSPYAFTKSTNTQLVKNYAEWYGLDYAITYFYNVYGPREISTGSYATLIAKFIDMVKHNKRLTITWPGTQERNFTHVDDIVAGLELVGEYGHGDEYGIGSPESFSILEVAQFILSLSKSDKGFMLTPEKKGNRMSAQVVTDKTRALGWEPKHHLKEYIENLLGEKT